MRITMANTRTGIKDMAQSGDLTSGIDVIRTSSEAERRGPVRHAPYPQQSRGKMTDCELA
ncbi:hypothetical protein DOTSEDRAFT_71532 [Dothistroma septosporum NZE10]|uniref:Uncharacterized protein n=1 Tax=Dothistroma septosporum (strain NZE10 / CBS 128990) TaxID=675120 RepID=N1PQZ1_DOTSN|nr:hypothetical protein DOTSEDRAFT_71532 [Dothistroma septosporum NZE10]